MRHNAGADHVQKHNQRALAHRADPIPVHHHMNEYATRKKPEQKNWTSAVLSSR